MQKTAIIVRAAKVLFTPINRVLPTNLTGNWIKYVKFTRGKKHNLIQMIFRILFFYILLIIPARLIAQNIEFIENQGQWNGSFKYKASTGRGDVYLENNCFTYLVGDGTNFTKIDDYQHGKIKDAPILKFQSYKMFFEGANLPELKGSKKETGYYNYYLGSDSSRWKSNIHPYHDMDYLHLYKDIDLHVSSDKGDIEYEFIVKPVAYRWYTDLQHNSIQQHRQRSNDQNKTRSQTVILHFCIISNNKSFKAALHQLNKPWRLICNCFIYICTHNSVYEKSATYFNCHCIFFYLGFMLCTKRIKIPEGGGSHHP